MQCKPRPSFRLRYSDTFEDALHHLNPSRIIFFACLILCSNERLPSAGNFSPTPPPFSKSNRTRPGQARPKPCLRERGASHVAFFLASRQNFRFFCLALTGQYPETSPSDSCLNRRELQASRLLLIFWLTNCRRPRAS